MDRTKLTDALGYPVGFALTAGQAADITQAAGLVPDEPLAAVIADLAAVMSTEPRSLVRSLRESRPSGVSVLPEALLFPANQHSSFLRIKIVLCCRAIALQRLLALNKIGGHMPATTPTSRMPASSTTLKRPLSVSDRLGWMMNGAAQP